jgi:hypothetical protein
MNINGYNDTFVDVNKLTTINDEVHDVFGEEDDDDY